MQDFVLNGDLSIKEPNHKLLADKIPDIPFKTFF